MAERRDRDTLEQSTGKPVQLGRDETADHLENLSSAEREWLASHVARAAEAVFPGGERIGKTAQQDFYFRELLEILIENVFQYGTPLCGGTYIELWQFTRHRAAKWRSTPDAKRGRSGYRRESIKTLVHEWKWEFARRNRAYAANGEVEFYGYSERRQ
jgi:hypothetical protein